MVKHGKVSDEEVPDEVTYKILYTYINRMGGKKGIGKMMARISRLTVSFHAKVCYGLCEVRWQGRITASQK